MVLTGLKVLPIDIITVNNRIYIEEIIFVSLLNCLNSPEYGRYILGNIEGQSESYPVTHICYNFICSDNWLICDMKIFDSVVGKELKEMVANINCWKLNPKMLGSFDCRDDGVNIAVDLEILSINVCFGSTWEGNNE